MHDKSEHASWVSVSLQQKEAPSVSQTSDATTLAYMCMRQWAGFTHVNLKALKTTRRLQVWKKLTFKNPYFFISIKVRKENLEVLFAVPRIIDVAQNQENAEKRKVRFE